MFGTALCMPSGDEEGHQLGHELVEIVEHRRRFPFGEVVASENRVIASELRRRGQGGDAPAARWSSWISPPRTLRRRILAAVRSAISAMDGYSPGHPYRRKCAESRRVYVKGGDSVQKKAVHVSCRWNLPKPGSPSCLQELKPASLRLGCADGGRPGLHPAVATIRVAVTDILSDGEQESLPVASLA
jgi:hypothetical protein